MGVKVVRSLKVVRRQDDTDTNVPITSSPVALVPSSGPSGQYSAAALGGAAAGCAVAGALISAVIVWLVMRSRLRRRTRDLEARHGVPTHSKPREKASHPRKAAAATVLSSEETSSAAIVENHLPQPKDDRTIEEELAKIESLIEQHSENFYSSRQVGNATHIDQATIAALGENVTLSATSLTTLLNDPATRIVMIRYFISSIIGTRLDVGGNPDTSFLPPAVTTFLKSTSPEEGNLEVWNAFFSKWCAISSYILTKGKSNKAAILPHAGHEQHILDAVRTLNSILLPYAESQYERDRVQNLTEIMRRSARFGFLLFSQPTLWKLDWQRPRDAGADAVVIFPALLQLSDENGKTLKSPRVFGAKRLTDKFGGGK
ncbi:MAG: hypothetical protein M1833_002926 [Piccolia ochrophora]|nr:MAG: hypothetical protein M1833_002926 [Piccolia ochrophora]